MKTKRLREKRCSESFYFPLSLFLPMLYAHSLIHLIQTPYNLNNRRRLQTAQLNRHFLPEVRNISSSEILRRLTPQYSALLLITIFVSLLLNAQ